METGEYVENIFLGAIVERTRKRIEEGRDDKGWVNFDEFMDILKAGGEIRRFNAEQRGGNYVHEIEYEGLIFQTVTREIVFY